MISRRLVARMLTPGTTRRMRFFSVLTGRNPWPDDANSVWERIWDEAAHQFKTQSWKSGDLQDFGIDTFLHADVLKHKSLACGLSHTIGEKLMSNANNGVDYQRILMSAFTADPDICSAVAADLVRFQEIDPASDELLGVYLFFKGVQALTAARCAHHFWTERGDAGKMIARLLQAEISDVYSVDIHPGARFGRGITIDHATGVTLGETCVIGDNGELHVLHPAVWCVRERA